MEGISVYLTDAAATAGGCGGTGAGEMVAGTAAALGVVVGIARVAAAACAGDVCDGPLVAVGRGAVWGLMVASPGGRGGLPPEQQTSSSLSSTAASAAVGLCSGRIVGGRPKGGTPGSCTPFDGVQMGGQGCIRKGPGGGSEGGGGGGWLGPPSSLGPAMVPAESGPKIFTVKSSWH